MNTKKIIIGLLVLCVFGAAVGYTVKFRVASKPHNGLIIMIDTLRADHLGVYGYQRDTTPTLNQFAKENTRAETAISVAPWTPPAVTSILTGLSVAHHGHNPKIQTGSALQEGQVLRDDIDTIAEIMKRDGYQTAGVSSNPWISKEFHFDQGFDQFIFKNHSGTEETFANARKAVAGIEKDPSKPFFLYVHILDPHGPYEPKGKYATMFSGSVQGTWPYPPEIQDSVNKYDEELRNVDDRVGEFFSFLKSKNLYDNTDIIVVSDHGEQFRERGDLGHGKMLHIEEVHVPLLVKCKDEHRVITGIVSNLDVSPTLLNCLNLPIPPSMDGISILDDAAVAKRGGVYSSVNRTFLQEAFTTEEGMRLIISKGRVENLTPDWGVEGAYNLPEDPLEQKPSFENDQVSELRGYLETAKSSLEPAVAPMEEKTKPVSNESAKELETLGYINN